MSVLPPRYDPLDPMLLDDPYPTYARLRDAARFCRGGPGQWAVTRYEDVAALLHHPALSSEFPAAYHEFSVGDGEASRLLQRILLYRDPPAHSRLRARLAPTFAPAALRAIRTRVDAIVDAQVAALRGRDRIDVVTDLAEPVPAAAICELLGIPAADRDRVRAHAAELGKAFGVQIAPEDRAAVDRATGALRELVGGLLAERRKRGGSDLLSALATTPAGETPLDDDEIVDNAAFLFFAGYETTTNLIGNGWAALTAAPAQLRRLQAEPALVHSAVDELLRFDPPIQGVARQVRSPLDLAGRIIRPGRVLLLLLGSANRDERRFARPDQLDIGRSDNHHLSFGGGIHGCLGAALARLESESVTTALIRRFHILGPAGAPVRRQQTRLRGFAHVPLAARERRDS